MFYDVIIVGGGASGLCTAIKAKKNNISVLVLEHDSKAGRKILSTGNGRCNLTNYFCKTERFQDNPEGITPYYTSGEYDFIYKVIDACDCEDAITFFNDIGILTLDKNGYIYPRSEQASTVRDILLSTCESLGVVIRTEYHVSSVECCHNADYSFSVNNGEFYCNYLVMAAGGASSNIAGSDGSGYDLVKTLGHKIVPVRPALCGIRCSDSFFKQLHGVRNDSTLSLYDDGTLIMQTTGNLQFTSYGVSGIPVFQMSSVCGKLLDEGHTPVIKIDLLPDYEGDYLTDFIDSHGSYRGVLHQKIASVIDSETRKDSYKHRNESLGVRSVPVIKRFKVHPVAVNPFEDAQTTAGGVDTQTIDPVTMESRLQEHLYFTGEIIDVDGICGGYNLQWAWSTAHIAAEDIVRKISMIRSEDYR